MGADRPPNGLWISDTGSRRPVHFLPEKNKAARANGLCSKFTLAFLLVQAPAV